MPGYERLALPIWIFDIDRKRMYWANSAGLRVWRADSLEALRSRDMSSDMSNSVHARLLQYKADFEAHDARFNEHWTLYPEGKPVSVNVHLSGFRLPDGRIGMLSEAHRSEALSPESLRSVEALMHTPVMISLYRHDGLPLYRNPAARESVRALHETLMARFVDAADARRMLEELAQRGQLTRTMGVHTMLGERWHEISARRQWDAVTGDSAILVSEVDVTPLKASEARALFLSQHDSLTGLANRAHVREHLAARLAEAAQYRLQLTLALIDLDRFKDVNDSWGHAAGDELLTEVSERLKRGVRRGDMVARLGGDEFLIMFAPGAASADATPVLDRLRRELAMPFVLSHGECRVSATIGVSCYPQHGADVESLLQQADMAMYAGKARGGNRVTFYEQGMGDAQRQRRAVEEDLARALERREFELYYQPRVDGRSGRIVGAEALVRWCHPQRGLVLPGDFIPICESSGLIRHLGRQVFEMAAAQQAAWRAAGIDIKLSVNLSPYEFRDEELLPHLEDTLRATGCEPSSLELEITESMLLSSDDRPLRTLQRLRALGISIALDDFGTGYSHLAYLQRFPFDTLKIDRTFVQAAPAERPLAEAIVALAGAMNLHKVAEGVETHSQGDWLGALGVTEFQGFLYARPQPRAAFEAMLAEPVLQPVEAVD